MNWKEYISELKVAKEPRSFSFNLPVDNDQLQNLQLQFNLVELPEELESLYKQTNGVIENFKEISIGELIWPIEKVIETNKDYRNLETFKELYMSFDQLLFFSDAGNGDCFGFVTLNGRFDRIDVFVWNHEEDSRTWVAPDLKTFMEWWLSGKIEM